MGFNDSMLGVYVSEKFDGSQSLNYLIFRAPSESDSRCGLLPKLRTARLEAYMRAGKVSESNIDGFFDLFDHTDNAYHVIAMNGEEICAGLRIHAYKSSSDPIPTARVFSEDFDQHFRNKTVLDHTRFFISRKFVGKSRAIQFDLFRRSFELAVQMDIDLALAPIVRSHACFYRKFLNFSEVSEREICYPPFGVPHILMAMSFRENAEEAFRRYPDFFRRTGDTKLQRRDLPYTPAAVQSNRPI